MSRSPGEPSCGPPSLPPLSGVRDHIYHCQTSSFEIPSRNRTTTMTCPCRGSLNDVAMRRRGGGGGGLSTGSQAHTCRVQAHNTHATMQATRWRRPHLRVRRASDVERVLRTDLGFCGDVGITLAAARRRRHFFSNEIQKFGLPAEIQSFSAPTVGRAMCCTMYF